MIKPKFMVEKGSINANILRGPSFIKFKHRQLNCAVQKATYRAKYRPMQNKKAERNISRARLGLSNK
jgi:hypothetical protein